MANFRVCSLVVARPLLYAAHWLLTLVIFAATAAGLRRLGPAASVCYFGRAYLCTLAVASGVVGWLFTTAAAGAWAAGLARGRRCGPPPRVEAAAWAAWAVWWAVTAAAVSAATPWGRRRSAGVAVEALAWALVPLCAASGGVAWVAAGVEADKGGGGGGMAPRASSKRRKVRTRE